LACIGRVRGLTQVRPVGEQDWMPVQAFVEMEDGQLLDQGLCEIGKTHPQRARLVVYKRPPRGRKDRGVHGRPRHSSAARAHARGAREPWVLRSRPPWRISAPRKSSSTQPRSCAFIHSDFARSMARR